jgi:hypothetical protein
MKIDKLNELRALIKLCRNTGVQSIEVDGIKLSLHQDALKLKTEPNVPTDNKDIESTPEYTDEQTLLWSTGALDGQGN